MAIELIKEVGPIPGTYLDKLLTKKHWKRENYVPNCADTLTYPEWITSGKKSAIDYARERMEEILATHEPTPLAAGQDKDIDRILKEARKYYKDKGML
ncbi:unnamed protein product [marine sediment metagenome]|uniref:Trimethylamine methyltransferase n=1 Tax=marine sediment metagenome TaxID=412755 RepID=X1LQN9_9ZZZZ